jgi:hypothetical protein
MVLGLSKIELILAVFLVFYILGDFDTPMLIMDSFKSIYPSIILFGLVIYLFMYGNGLIFLLTCFALYRLIERVDNKKYQQVKEGFVGKIEKIDGNDIPVVSEKDIIEEMPERIEAPKESAMVTEAFTSALTENSLEKQLIDKESPVGKGTQIKYKSSNYKPVKDKLIGASLA